MGLNDLNENYRNDIKEKERLKQNLQIFIDENRAAAEHIKKIENNLENYQKNAQNIIQDKDYLVNQLEKSEKKNQELSEQVARYKAQITALNLQNKSIPQNIDQSVNISDKNFINALNKQIARLQSDKKNLENQNKILGDEKVKNIETIQSLQMELGNIKNSQEIKNVEGNIMMNSDMSGMIQQYKSQIMDLTNKLNDLHNENVLLQNQRNMMASNSNDNSRYPRSVANNYDSELRANQL